MCASTLCPLSSSTRNCVLGNASVTAPSTSMTSSLAKDLSFPTGYKIAGAKRISYHAHAASHTANSAPLPAQAPVFRQHPRAVLRHRDRVLEVGRERAVGGVDRPLVLLVEVYRVVAQRDHGLYGERHPRLEPYAGPLLAVVRDLGVLGHVPPDPVRDEVAHHAVAFGLGDGLYGVPHVAEPVPGPHRLRGGGEAVLGNFEQSLRLFGHLADGYRGRRVGDEAPVADADVDGEDVALLQAVGARDAVHDHGVRGGADGAREVRRPGGAGVALELGAPAVGADKVLRHRVELAGRDAGAGVLGE